MDYGASLSADLSLNRETGSLSIKVTNAAPRASGLEQEALQNVLLPGFGV